MHGPDHPTFRVSLKKLLAAVGLLCCEFAAFRLWLGHLQELERRFGYVDFGAILLTLLMGGAIVVSISHVTLGWSILAIGFRKGSDGGGSGGSRENQGGVAK